MLNGLFQPFIEKSPVTVIARGLLEHALNPAKLNDWFENTALSQYTRKLLFSSIFQMMHEVVFTIKPSINAAFQPLQEELDVSVQSVYNKLNALEPTTSTELVRYTAEAISPIIKEMKGSREPLLPGFRLKMLDGNCIDVSKCYVRRQRHHCRVNRWWFLILNLIWSRMCLLVKMVIPRNGRY